VIRERLYSSLWLLAIAENDVPVSFLSH